MKILVLSDSHGTVGKMAEAVEKESPRMILHLGDGWRDAQKLHDRYPHIAFHQVPGNCDYRSAEPKELLFEIQGKRILMCHGHTYGVKQSLLTAALAAEEQDLDAFLFGHTHTPLVDIHGKTTFLNPGSISSLRPTYGLLTIENGVLRACTAYL